jgi:hypothetical protein
MPFAGFRIFLAGAAVGTGQGVDLEPGMIV